MRSIASLVSVDLQASELELIRQRSELLRSVNELLQAVTRINDEFALREQGRQYAADAAADAATAIHD